MRKVELTIDTEQQETLSLTAFRRRPWPTPLGARRCPATGLGGAPGSPRRRLEGDRARFLPRRALPPLTR